MNYKEIAWSDLAWKDLAWKDKLDQLGARGKELERSIETMDQTIWEIERETVARGLPDFTEIVEASRHSSWSAVVSNRPVSFPKSSNPIGRSF